MLSLTANVVNVFRAPEGTNRDGEKFGGESKVQLQCVNLLKNGEKRVELYTLTTARPDVFEKSLGKEVTVPVGAFSSSKGLVIFLAENPPAPKA